MFILFATAGWLGSAGVNLRTQLPWLVAIIVFSAIAFAMGNQPWTAYLLPFAAFLVIFIVLNWRRR